MRDKDNMFMVNLPSYIAGVFVVICTSYAMLHEGGMFSISEEQKIQKIKQCTVRWIRIKCGLLIIFW